MYIDGAVFASHVNDHMNMAYITIPIVATISLLCVNLFSVEVIASGGGMWGGADSSVNVKRGFTWLFMVGLFACFISSIVIFVTDYAQSSGRQLWPGFSIIGVNGLIMASALVYKFARTTSESY